MTADEDIAELKAMIEEHAQATASEKAKAILSDFDNYIPKFKKIIPHDYAKIQSTVKALEKTGVPHEKAEIEAFELIRKEA